MTDELDPTPYLDVPLRFHGYYKYTFTFQGTLGGRAFTVDVGGDSTDIYRMSVDADQTYTIREGCDGYAFDLTSIQEIP
jgi:hypothetical protein